MRFWRCLLYLALVGFAAFLLGRMLPKKWFDPGRPPFRSWSFEREGAIYDRVGVRRWQKRLPDMSRLFPRMILPKRMTRSWAESLPELIRETCVAEFTHALLAALGLVAILLWPGPVGGIMGTLYCLLNLPFIVVQRFNRPRLIRLARRADRTGARREQHRAGVLADMPR